MGRVAGTRVKDQLVEARFPRAGHSQHRSPSSDAYQRVRGVRGQRRVARPQLESPSNTKSRRARRCGSGHRGGRCHIPFARTASPLNSGHQSRLEPPGKSAAASRKIHFGVNRTFAFSVLAIAIFDRLVNFFVAGGVRYRIPGNGCRLGRVDAENG